MAKKKNNEILKANFVGLTVTLRVSNDGHGYTVEVQYLQYRNKGDWPSSLPRQAEYDMFTLEKKKWHFINIIEAAGKFEKVRNNVRNLGEFRNLNKGKIPDYRDSVV